MNYLRVQRQYAAVIVLMLLVSGCGIMNVGTRPATFEQVTFSALMGAQAAIEEARPKIEDGTLPASLAPPFNAFVDGYNEARAAMLAYDTAVQQGTGDETSLQTAVNRAIDALQFAWLTWSAARAEVQ